MPKAEALGHIRSAIEKTYGKRGETVLARNFARLKPDQATLAGLVLLLMAIRGGQLRPAPWQKAS